jgi:hypothetical protein
MKLPSNYIYFLLLLKYSFIPDMTVFRGRTNIKENFTVYIYIYRVFRAQADWTFILSSGLPAKELRHLPRKMPPRGTTY